MIQRRQTLFLAFAALLFGCLFLFPFADIRLGTMNAGWVSTLGIQFFGDFMGLETVFSKLGYLFVIMQLLATLFLSLTCVAIFMHKKRPLQVRLCAFAYITNILMIGAMFLTGSLIEEQIHNLSLNYSFAMYIPVISLFPVYLAQRAIRKDEAMVQSLNRLR